MDELSPIIRPRKALMMRSRGSPAFVNTTHLGARKHDRPRQHAAPFGADYQGRPTRPVERRQLTRKTVFRLQSARQAVGKLIFPKSAIWKRRH